MIFLIISLISVARVGNDTQPQQKSKSQTAFVVPSGCGHCGSFSGRELQGCLIDCGFLSHKNSDSKISNILREPVCANELKKRDLKVAPNSLWEFPKNNNCWKKISTAIQLPLKCFHSSSKPLKECALEHDKVALDFMLGLGKNDVITPGGTILRPANDNHVK